MLLAAFGAVFGMLALNQLPWLYNPLFRKRNFRRVTADRFAVVIEATDPLFDIQRTTDLLQELGATSVEEVED
ncbi:MAG: DUF3341 domain-containing protein [Phycisphaeraceae bacterium]|nr:DUF3341 domain-containing protein [Phycisphaeraceae bacterium]